jgi:hypothetical protein
MDFSFWPTESFCLSVWFVYISIWFVWFAQRSHFLNRIVRGCDGFVQSSSCYMRVAVKLLQEVVRDTEMHLTL